MPIGRPLSLYLPLAFRCTHHVLTYEANIEQLSCASTMSSIELESGTSVMQQGEQYDRANATVVMPLLGSQRDEHSPVGLVRMMIVPTKIFNVCNCSRISPVHSIVASLLLLN